MGTYLPLFVYGTLRPGQPAWRLVAGAVVKRVPATARGRWVGTGRAFPAVSFTQEGAEIPGELLWLWPDWFERTILAIDAYEAAPTLFHRVKINVCTAHGEEAAYAYQWGPALTVSRARDTEATVPWKPGTSAAQPERS